MLRWIALLALVICAAAARAQVKEQRLDASGTWVLTESKPLDADAQLIAKAREALAEGKGSQAKSLLTPWIEAHATSEHPLLAQAYLLRGDAILIGGNEFKALYDYEAVAKGFPQTEEYKRAVERELEIGIKYVFGLKRIWLGIRWSDATDYGEELLIRVQERLPGSDLAERAGIELADYYFRTRDLKLAADAYEIFVENFPKSHYAERARERRIYANIARFKGPQYDATGLADAQELIKKFAQSDPVAARRADTDALAAKLDESAAEQIMEKALWYQRRGDLVSMKYSLQRLIAKQPATVAAKTALKMLQERGWPVVDPKPDSNGDTP